MLALQGPGSRRMIVEAAQDRTGLPEPYRNAVGIVAIAGARVMVARTGYTGKPLGFELFVTRKDAPACGTCSWKKGPSPAGLAARDTLRLEASLPLHGHEFGTTLRGEKSPVSRPMAKGAVSFSSLKGEFVGPCGPCQAVCRLAQDRRPGLLLIAELPRMFKCVAVTGRGIARAGARSSRAAGRRLYQQRHDGSLPGLRGKGLLSRRHRRAQASRHMFGILDSECRR